MLKLLKNTDFKPVMFIERNVTSKKTKPTVKAKSTKVSKQTKTKKPVKKKKKVHVVHDHESEDRLQFVYKSWYYENYKVLIEPDIIDVIKQKHLRGKANRRGREDGQLDIWIPKPMGGFHGMYVELKRPNGDGCLSDEQKVRIEQHEENGYFVLVTYLFEHAKKVTELYMAGQIKYSNKSQNSIILPSRRRKQQKNVKFLDE